jgi:hypothetical protein
VDRAPQYLQSAEKAEAVALGTASPIVREALLEMAREWRELAAAAEQEPSRGHDLPSREGGSSHVQA